MRQTIDRRVALRLFAGGAAACAAPAFAQTGAPLTRTIPSSGEAIPLVGLGSWITFNVGNDPAARDVLRGGDARILRGRRTHDRFLADVRLLAAGDRLRPRRSSAAANVFSADKVWISSGARGPAQIEASRAYWGVPHFDLLQVHNLLAWEEHLPTLFAMKAAGRLRYVGITTSEGRRHDDFEKIMRSAPARFRAGHLQHPRPRGRATHPAARARARHRGDRQPAVPRGRADQEVERKPLPPLRRRYRRDDLGAVHPQVHHLASGGDLRDPGDDARRSCAGERWRCARSAAGRRDARAHRRAVEKL